MTEQFFYRGIWNFTPGQGASQIVPGSGPPFVKITTDTDGTASPGDAVTLEVILVDGGLAEFDLLSDAGIQGNTAFFVGTARLNGGLSYLFKGNASPLAGNESFLVIRELAEPGISIPFALNNFALAVEEGRAASLDTSASAILGGGIPRELIEDLICFAAGSAIATPDGSVAVETLKIGDRVLTASGGTSDVIWIGRQTITNAFGLAQRSALVRIRAGALGNGLPHRDLTVTADHGMIIDGYVINASALVNGATIDFVPLAELEDSFCVYHIETDNHDVILANGAPSETFVDAVGRKAFDNYQEYLDLYGAERIIPEMPKMRIATSRLVPRVIKDRLAPSEKWALERTRIALP